MIKIKKCIQTENVILKMQTKEIKYRKSEPIKLRSVSIYISFHQSESSL